MKAIGETMNNVLNSATVNEVRHTVEPVGTLNGGLGSPKVKARLHDCDRNCTKETWGFLQRM